MALHSTSPASSDMAVASLKENDDLKEIKVEAIISALEVPVGHPQNALLVTQVQLASVANANKRQTY